MNGRSKKYKCCGEMEQFENVHGSMGLRCDKCGKIVYFPKHKAEAIRNRNKKHKMDAETRRFYDIEVGTLVAFG